MQIQLNSCGLTKTDMSWVAPRFVRVHHCIMFLMSGKLHYLSDDEDVLLIPGHLYITPIHRAYEIE
jgi:hypothetical protein